MEKAEGQKEMCKRVWGGVGEVGLCKEQGQKTQLHCVSLRLKHEQPLCPTSRFRVPARSCVYGRALCAGSTSGDQTCNVQYGSLLICKK